MGEELNMKFCHKYIKRLLAGLLLVCLIGVSMSHVYATGNSASNTDVSDLEDQREETLEEIENLKDSISDVKEEIDTLKSEKYTIQKYINQLDQKFNNLTAEIEDFEKKIEEKKADIEETKVKLEETKIACDEQYASMKLRIRFIYENPSASLFELIITSGSISEALNKAEYVFSMSDYERQMMDKLIETKEQIELQELTLEAELEELDMMQAELEKQKVQVNASINAKKGELSSKAAEISDANAEQSDYQAQLKEQEKLLNEIEEQIARAAQPDVYEGESTGFIWPCPAYTRISSYFGPRPQPVPGASTNHKGVDLAAPYGANILASAAGVVTTSKYSASAGNYVVIAHGNGMSTVYMHASSLLVSVGQTVSQGQVIAKVGSTGYSSGNHLHFGVIKNGTYVNPLNYI